MFTNSHFAIATHVLAVLTIRRDEPVPSAQIAASVNTNPAFLRTLLGRLREAGLVDVVMGPGGGALLARDPKTVSLWDVYQAVESQPAMTLHRCEPNAKCLVGGNIIGVLEDVTNDVENAVKKQLEAIDLTELERRLRKQSK